MLKKRLKGDVFSILPPLKRKGQVTVFIILGIIILLTIILLLLYIYEVVKFRPDVIIPTQKGTIETYLENCLGQIAEEGLTTMGIQGGYIEVPEHQSNDASRHLRVSPIVVIPYWAYGTETAIPSAAQLKERLDRHVEKNLRTCVLGQNTFTNSYTITEKSEIRADTELLDKKTVFKVYWELEIKNKAGEVITTIADHTYDSPIKLKSIHTLASRIITAELAELKFEDITQDLIALEHPRLPVAGLDFSCSKKQWKIKDAENTLKALLRVNIREMQIKGTNTRSYAADTPYYQSHYIWNIGPDINEKDLTVQFNFDENYPFTFDVTPRTGAYLKSSDLATKNKYLQIFCLQNWKFAYDTSFPVLMTLFDDTTGYSFRVPFTVHLQNNLPNRNLNLIPSQTRLTTTLNDDDFCSNRRIPMTVQTTEVVDNPFTGVYTTQPLEGVNVTFTCLKYECSIGKTEYNFAGMGDVAALTANFPYCVGGIMRAQKPNYAEQVERVVTQEGTIVDIKLIPQYPVKSTKINVVKHILSEQGIPSPAQPLNDNEYALITISFNRGNETYNPNHMPNHESSVVLTPTLDPAIAEAQNLIFLGKAEFTYDLNINVFAQDELTASYNTNWTLPWSELQGLSQITFHTLTTPLGEDAKFELLQNLAAQSTKVPAPEVR